MAVDMKIDLMAERPFGKRALAQMVEEHGPLKANFRLYFVEMLGAGKGMRVRGAEFRAAKTGKNKGQMTIRVPKTGITVIVR